MSPAQTGSERTVAVDTSKRGRGILGRLFPCSLWLCWLPAIHAEPESLLANWLFTLTALLSWLLPRQYLSLFPFPCACILNFHRVLPSSVNHDLKLFDPAMIFFGWQVTQEDRHHRKRYKRGDSIEVWKCYHNHIPVCSAEGNFKLSQLPQGSNFRLWC